MKLNRSQYIINQNYRSLIVLSSKYLLNFLCPKRRVGSFLLIDGFRFGMRPAFCAIETKQLIRTCCFLHNPVIRRGNMHPSDLTYCERMRTSVCLTSRPRVHLGQNCVPFSRHSRTSFSRRCSLGAVLVIPCTLITPFSSFSTTERDNVTQKNVILEGFVTINDLSYFP